MDVGWSRFRGFEDRSEVILLTIEALEFINLTRRLREGKATEFQVKFIDKRVKSFEKFFEMFMPFFTELNQRHFKNALNFARSKEYNKIDKNVLDEMQYTLERFNSALSAAQSRDMELLRAMR
jgi:hypothetical protein